MLTNGKFYPGAYLAYEYLRNADLRDVDLRNADLRSANLTRASLCNTNLDGANLSLARLCNADLDGASLYNTNLSGADLYNTNTSNIKFNISWPNNPHSEGWEIETTRSGFVWVRGYRSALSSHAPVWINYTDKGKFHEAYPYLDVSNNLCQPGIYLCKTREDALKWSASIVEVWTPLHLIHFDGDKHRTQWIIT